MGGIALGWTSPVLYILQNSPVDTIPLDHHITREEAAWINSLKSLGAIPGAFVTGFLARKYGRRVAQLLSALPFFISFMVLAFAKNVTLYYVGRFIMGIGIGATFCIIPLYLVEISENVNRGFLLASKTTFLTLGIFVAFCIGPFVSIMVFNLISAVFCVMHLLLFWWIAPETPHFLIVQGKNEKAFQSLECLRNRPSEQLHHELEDLKSSLQLSQGSYLDIFTKRAPRKALVYIIICLTFGQFTGTVVLISYSQTIFQDAGTNISSHLSSIVVGAIEIIPSIIAPYLVERFGRRCILLILVFGATVGNILLGTYFYLKDNQDVSEIYWLPLLAFIIATVSYYSGIAAIPWGFVGELVPIEVRSEVSMIVTAFNWLTGFLITKYYFSVSSALTVEAVFWFFAACSAAFECFIYFFIFETRGKSLKNIQDMLEI